MLQLGSQQSQHVLATVEKSLAGCIIDSGLSRYVSGVVDGKVSRGTYLRLVEAFKCRLLTSCTTNAVRLQNAGIYEFGVCHE